MDKMKIVEIVKQLTADNVVVEYEKIPEIDLYMDQLTTFTEDKLKTYKRKGDDKILTKTMINNYSKDKLIPPSANKKYSRAHIALMMMIYHLKNNMAINDLGMLVANLRAKECSFDELYKAFTEIQKMENERLESEVYTKIEALKGLSEKEDLAILTIISLLIDANSKKRAAEKILDELIETETKK